MLEEKILQFLNNPSPIWETELTKNLVDAELIDLSQFNLDLNTYSTQKSYFKSNIGIEEKPILLSGISSNDSIHLEYPQMSSFSFFYEEHGLEPESPSKINDETVQKLKEALNVFKQVPDAAICISHLVKRIQVLKQFDDEIDTSYSHPLIPFSIFVSLCSDSSTISNLRVTESILHEAMHLKLTLIEKYVSLIIPNSIETYYSPWRDEQRPVRGVLHGIFVFRSILEFYRLILSYQEYQIEGEEFIKSRINDIENELQLVSNFIQSSGLTNLGSLFCSKLI